MEQKVKIKVEQVDNGSVFKWSSNNLRDANLFSDDAVFVLPKGTETLVAKKEEEVQTLGKMIWEDINHILDQECTYQIELDITYKTVEPNETQD